MGSVIFAGGGTGGHIFPALAIAQELCARDDAVQIEYLVSQREVDARILRAADATFTALPAKAFGVKPDALVRFAKSWGPSVRASRAVLREARAEHGRTVLVAMGGFVAAPAVQAARAEGVLSVLVNLDAAPGRANRWIAKRSSAHLTACNGPSVPDSWERTGPIVRREVLSDLSASECRERWSLDPSMRTLLVTGGSQGASSINGLMMALCDQEAELFEGWQVIHQCGDGDSEVVQSYEKAGVRAVVRPFIKDMGTAWGAADLVISRSGAGAVAEAWATGTPAIFLPYPYHRDEHQRLNAQPLADAGAAVILEDHVDPAANLEAHLETLASLFGDAGPLGKMVHAFGTLGPVDGATRTADRVGGLLDAG